RHFFSTVAVGTLITERPPQGSVRARLRIRLLPRMRSGEASHGIRVQNAGSRNPTAEERIESIPSYLSPLAAPHAHLPGECSQPQRAGCQLQAPRRSLEVGLRRYGPDAECEWASESGKQERLHRNR